eukprot:762433-Hanusia_phi.AAC.22
MDALHHCHDVGRATAVAYAVVDRAVLQAIAAVECDEGRRDVEAAVEPAFTPRGAADGGL